MTVKRRADMPVPNKEQIEAAAKAIKETCNDIDNAAPEDYAKAALTAAAEVGEPTKDYFADAMILGKEEERKEMNATIERCAQVADKYATGDDLASDIAREIANEQRALKDK